MNLKLQVRGGWGDGLVDKVLVVQVWRSEFTNIQEINFKNPHPRSHLWLKANSAEGIKTTKE